MMRTKWQEKLKDNPVPWLLESNPWTKYRTLIDLMEIPPSSTKIKDAKNELCSDPQVRALMVEASQWFPQCITRHNDAKIYYYKLMMLAEFGLNIEDKEIREVTNKAIEHMEDGLFAVRQVLPETGQGFSKPDLTVDEWHALPCDSPIITYSLLLLGLNNLAVRKSIDRLKNKWETEPGWFCHFFFVES